MKKLIISISITLALILSMGFSVFADDNADSGDGEGEGMATGKGYYKSNEWMYKVSVYVGLKDTATTDNSLNFSYKKIGQPVFVKPSTFTVPNGTIFGKSNNKVDYLNGVNLSLSYSGNVKIITDNPPPPPITHTGGNITAVKSYFGDTGTLQRLLDAIAQQAGTSKAGLVSDIEFTIDGVKGKKDPDIILPYKSGNKYLNQVPWVIVYEPVIIAHLKDGTTKLAFTATEYAMVQAAGIYDFFFANEQAQFIAGMTHINLPNSIVLEYDWLGFLAYPPTNPVGSNKYWSNERIIQGGGWGMRFLEANEAADSTLINKNEEASFRINTDVILSFRIAASREVNPDNPVRVTFYVDGVNVGSMSGIVMPSGGSQLAWLKWRTPSVPKTAKITASISGGGGKAYFVDTSQQTVNIVDMNQNIPPDPVAKDPKTGQPVQKPLNYKIPSNVPIRAEKKASTWGEYWAWWQSVWVWVDDGEGGGSWEDRGYWVFEWDSYSLSLVLQDYEIVPDEKVPTAKEVHRRWQMGSGYGINVNVKTRIETTGNPSNSSYTGTQTVVTYFPEFNYLDFWRLLEKMDNGFELKNNKYSTYNRRVHFTPLWYPDGEYTTHTEIYDLWTPEGMLFRVASDTIDIQGSVFDDWTVVPAYD